jgi:hypothetical protein
MRQQPNYSCMLKNLLKLYCIWTWDALWGLFFVCFVFSLFPLWWDNDRTTSETPSPGLEAEKLTPKLLRLKLYWTWTWRFFFHLFIFYFYYFIIFYFQSSLCLANACSAYCWLVHYLSLFTSLKLFFVFFLFVFPLFINFFAFPLLSPFHSTYYHCYYYNLEKYLTAHSTGTINNTKGNERKTEKNRETSFSTVKN